MGFFLSLVTVAGIYYLVYKRMEHLKAKDIEKLERMEDEGKYSFNPDNNTFH